MGKTLPPAMEFIPINMRPLLATTRGLFTCSFFIMAVSTLLVWEISPFPVLIISPITILGVTVYHNRFDTDSFVAQLSIVVLVGVWLRFMIFMYPDSYIGYDPNRYNVQIQNVIAAGKTGVINSQFYENVPSFIVYNAITELVTGLGIRRSQFIIPFVFAVELPLVAATLANRLLDSRRWYAVLSASIVTIAPLGLKFSYTPIPQSLAVAISAALLLILPRYFAPMTESKSRWSVVLIILIVALVFTHKLPILLITFLTVTLAIFGRLSINPLSKVKLSKARGIPIIALTGVLILFMWGLQTDFLTFIGLRVVGFLEAPGQVSGPDPTAAVAIGESVLYRIGLEIHWIGLYSAGGVLIATLLFNHSWKAGSRTLLMLASGSTFVVGLTGIGVVTGSFNVLRIVFLAELLIIPLAVVSVANVQRSNFRRLAAIGLLVIVASQVLMIGYTPGDHREPRMYLHGGEADARGHALAYQNGTIFTDSDFVRLGISPTPKADRYWSRNQGTMQSADKMILNASFSGLSEDNIVLIRTRKRLYHSLESGGIWRLSYQPSEHLGGQCSSIYDNSQARMYTGC